MAFICDKDDEAITLNEGDVVIWQSDGWDDVLSALIDHAETYLPDDGTWDAERVIKAMKDFL